MTADGMKLLKTIFLSGVIGFAATGIASAADDPVRIPVITALTGPVAVLGQDAQKGTELAQEAINKAGGIGGRPVSFQIVDTQGRPDVVRREMERLTRLEKMPLVVGCEISAGTASAAQFAESAQVPLVNLLSVSADILERGYKWYFAEQITGDDEAAAALGYLSAVAPGQDLSGKSFALLYEDSPRGAGTATRIRKLLGEKGLKVVSENSYNRADRNLLALMRKVQDSKPDILIWANYAEDAVAGLKAMKQLDFYPYVLGIGAGLGDPRLPELVDPDLIQKVHVSNVDYFSPDIARAKALREAFQARYKLDPSSYAGACYAGLLTLKEPLEKAAAGGALTPTAIRDALRAVNIPGDTTSWPAKSIHFDVTGRNIGAQALVSQWVGGRSKSTVYPPEIAVAKPAPLP
ncbi:ABC transporter substrate-binding protein [Bradyrhizobium sp. AS23.2]|uniref:ABC transporter substrate-binding protein n=1 Tax=Bradyrhizobium sp. AS23.2 TaxID=1680155 RepID=UPI0011611A96|nr:ABC transporter substrate-binding protein [Bradyrhizobium sp. AS23.2]